MSKWSIASAQTRDQVYDALYQLLNRTSERQARAILIDILDEIHPTLEQGFWRLVRDTAKHYAEAPDNYFDQRNLGSQGLVKHIAEWNGQLPLI